MATLKKLPIGLQTFDDLIQGDYVYADKTKQIYDLIKQKSVYFFARPRRFGKSLLLSTMKAIFEGKRDLFRGLAIDDTDHDWKSHPVVMLDMGAVDSTDINEVPTLIKTMLYQQATQFGVSIIASSAGQMLLDLIEKIYQQQGSVVILIDEYDKPLLNVINDPQRLKIIKEEISYFYGALKRADRYLRFLFLTGVSRFSRTSIFSGLNQLEDISLTSEHSTLCGYTDDELDHYFAGYLKLMDCSQGDMREKIRSWYDGYRFHHQGLRVYNPFSILNFFKQKEFKNYWFATGTPTFLLSLLKDQQFNLLSDESLTLSGPKMSDLTIENLDCVSVLYQTGYVTIDHYDADSDVYALRVANLEVNRSLFGALMDDVVKSAAYTAIYVLLGDLKRAVINNDFARVIEVLKTMYAKIPYTISIPLERYYQTIFYTIFLLAGFDIIVEDATSSGRIDVVVTTKTHRYIIELKLNKTAAEAIAQIKNMNYAAKFADDHRSIVLVGINFDSEKRMITEWMSE